MVYWVDIQPQFEYLEQSQKDLELAGAYMFQVVSGVVRKRPWLKIPVDQYIKYIVIIPFRKFYLKQCQELVNCIYYAFCLLSASPLQFSSSSGIFNQHNLKKLWAFYGTMTRRIAYASKLFHVHLFDMETYRHVLSSGKVKSLLRKYMQRMC